MKRKIYITIGMILFLALINTVMVTKVFALQDDIDNLSGIQPQGIEYTCFWWADDFWSGPITKDCDGCLDRPMKNPSMMSTCTFGIGD